MSRPERPAAPPPLLRPWAAWLYGAVAAVQAWGFADNVADGERVLAAVFAVATIAAITLTVMCLRLRHRANR